MDLCKCFWEFTQIYILALYIIYILALIPLLQKSKMKLDQNEIIMAIILDLSEAFDWYMK